MITKEETILFPMVLETFNGAEWLKVFEGTDELGYCLVEPGKGWGKVVDTRATQAVMPQEAAADPSEVVAEAPDAVVKLGTGVLKVRELEAMLNVLPVDISFIDKDNVVKYFSQNKEKIFPRTKAIIGRKVENCHPPASVPAVERVVDNLRSGRREHEDFWIRMKGMYVLIRYYAVRGTDGEFLGVLEVTQDIEPLRAIEGEKRLSD
jgi:DUF438 domain-containing protein